MSRRKRQPEAFDVVEFLRESDDDLKSALNSLLRAPAETPETVSLGPETNLIPDPILVSQPAVEETPPQVPIINIGPGSESTAGIKLVADPDVSTVEPKLTPEPNLEEYKLDPDLNLTAGLESGRRHYPIREMKAARDAHTRAEQQVYEYLWEKGLPLDGVSRTITIGFGTLAQEIRLSESNARINTRSLIAKLAMEEFAHYVCERSVGRTYRIFDEEEIVRRRREAGLTWYMRRTQAVVFVDPASGQPLDLGVKRPRHNKRPGIKLIPVVDDEAGSPIFHALRTYGEVDSGVIRRLRTETRRICADATDEEIAHFIHGKGELIRKRGSLIANPVGFLLTSVPKCFAGDDFLALRRARQEAREQEATERRQQEAELETWRREQLAILHDPSASEEDRHWARKNLYPDGNSGR
jgi:hypothetical protein